MNNSSDSSDESSLSEGLMDPENWVRYIIVRVVKKKIITLTHLYQIQIQHQMLRGQRPSDILRALNRNFKVPPHMTESILWRLLVSAFNPLRRPLKNVCSLTDFTKLLRTCQKIIVLCGAGVSTSCGVPDFRSSDGIYERLAKDFPNLPDPQVNMNSNSIIS